jgi:serine/threonine protein kinase
MKKRKKVDFQEFFALIRDSILGTVFMHTNSIAHRDIKPGNIMKLDSNKYVIADYGEGVNLNFLEQYKIGDFYQVDNWDLCGTPGYWDPIL